jgi:hypothetical protein
MGRRFAQKHRTLLTWARWFAANGIARAHIITALDLDEATLPAHIAACLDGPKRGATRPRRPAPDRRYSTPSCCTLRSLTARKARRLAELGYAPATIARVLAVKKRALEALLCNGSPRHPPPVSPWHPTDYAEAWRYYGDRGPDHELIRPPEPAEIFTAAVEPPAAPPAPPPWINDDDPRPHARGPRKLAPDQIREAGELLRSGATYHTVAKRFGVSVNTLRCHVGDVGTRRPPSNYPTQAVTYERGTVRWDLPLMRGRRIQVRIDCDCGRQRYIDARKVDRLDKTFTGQCSQCRWTSGPPCPKPSGQPPIVLSP